MKEGIEKRINRMEMLKIKKPAEAGHRKE